MSLHLGHLTSAARRAVRRRARRRAESVDLRRAVRSQPQALTINTTENKSNTGMNPASIDLISLPRRASQMDSQREAAMHTTKNPLITLTPVVEPSPWTAMTDAKNATAELVPYAINKPTPSIALSTGATGTRKKLPALDPSGRSAAVIAI